MYASVYIYIFNINTLLYIRIYIQTQTSPFSSRQSVLYCTPNRICIFQCFQNSRNRVIRQIELLCSARANWYKNWNVPFYVENNPWKTPTILYIFNLLQQQHSISSKGKKSSLLSHPFLLHLLLLQVHPILKKDILLVFRFSQHYVTFGTVINLKSRDL